MIELDGVRGLAIGTVLVWHYVACQIGEGGHGLAAFAAQSASLFWGGVNLFFVLSGFLITGILLDNRTTPNLLRVFYTRRFFRIVPLYLLVCSVFALAVIYQSAQMGWLIDDPLPLWSYFTFTQNFVMAARDTFGAHSMSITWSLAVEEQFYLLIPFMVRFMRPRTVFVLFVAMVLAAPVLRALVGGVGAYVLFLARADSIMMGGLLAFLVRDERALGWVRRQRTLFLGSLAVLAAGAVVITYSYVEPPLSSPFVNLWLSLLCALVVLLPFACPGIRLTGLLRLKPLCWLGTRSYGLYMLHMAVVGVLHGALLNWNPALYSVESGLTTVLALVATFVLAEVSYQVFELPLLRIGQRARYGTVRRNAESPAGDTPPPFPMPSLGAAG